MIIHEGSLIGPVATIRKIDCPQEPVLIAIKLKIIDFTSHGATVKPGLQADANILRV